MNELLTWRKSKALQRLSEQLFVLALFFLPDTSVQGQRREERKYTIRPVIRLTKSKKSFSASPSRYLKNPQLVQYLEVSHTEKDESACCWIVVK